MGSPKALIRDEHGVSWVVAGVRVLREAGCAQVVVVLGAAADEAENLLAAESAHVVRSPSWARGMGLSLRDGLTYVIDSMPDADAVAIHLVDLPDTGADVVARVLEAARAAPLVRAAYGVRPGHPVVIAREHWDDLRDVLDGDRGAQEYLDAHHVELVQCSDLATGRDVDHS